MKLLYAVIVLVFAIGWGDVSITAASSSGQTPTPPVSESPSARPLPVRVSAVSTASLPASISYQRMDELVVMWKIGPACSGAGASKGTFDRVDVKELRDDVIVTLYLKDVVVNPKPERAAKICPVHTPTNVRIVPLERPLGKRLVHDWACPASCRVRKLTKADQQYFITQLR